MEAFGMALKAAARLEDQEMLGAIASVFNGSGQELYHFAAGRTRLDHTSVMPNNQSTIYPGSAGKFLTHMAAILLVQNGKLDVDEPIAKYVPELAALPIIEASQTSHPGFNLRPQTIAMTLQHLLTHTSGVAVHDHPLITQWATSESAQTLEIAPGAPNIVRLLSQPLIFEPGQGWYYGNSVNWLPLVIERVSGQRFLEFMEQHIFSPLNLAASSYRPRDDLVRVEIQTVRRCANGGIEPAPEHTLTGMMCSVADMRKALSTLLSTDLNFLTAASKHSLLTPALLKAGPALEQLRIMSEVYAAPAGIPIGHEPSAVNFNMLGALVTEEVMPISRLPSDTVMWSGDGNVVWALHPKSDVGIIFATQLVPVDDDRVMPLLMRLFQAAAHDLIKCRLDGESERGR